MPLTLIVRFIHDDATFASPTPLALTFDGSRVVLGRGSGCDVRLPDPSVSHRHASVRVDGQSHTLVDEGSTNGTFVGGVKLVPQTPRALRSGDLVRVGRVWLEVRIDQTPATRDLSLATRELALLLVSQAMDAQGDDVVAKVRVVEGPDRGAVLALSEEGRAYTVGRDSLCDLPIADVDASREHVLIVRRGSVVLVRDLDSKNGVFVGDSRVPRDREAIWRSAAMVRLGATVLALEEPVSSALVALEEAEDEPMAPEDVPPEPVSAAAAAADLPESSASIASATAAPTPSAPIAQVIAEALAATAVRKRRGWSATDMGVVLLAIAVIAMSLAGLFWLLRG